MRKKPDGKVRAAKIAPPAKTKAAAEPPPPDSPPPPAPVPVIGIGGSAGSLEAFKHFFSTLPPDLGAAYVVLQHLDPAKPSLLTELLSGYSALPVQQAQDGQPVAADHIYVIPPNAYITLDAGVLRLREPPKTDMPRMPIDIFFRSLAEDRADQAVCIILSGAGSDGTLGLRAVRGAGGTSLVQDPATAQHADMPHSAIATGLVDFILPPAKMGEALLDFLTHVRIRPAHPEVAAPPGTLDAVLTYLLARTGSDFRCYKKATIARRIERRMGLAHIKNLADYVPFLKAKPEEIRLLQKDLLICVTGFFRDPEAFEELRTRVIQPLVQLKAPGDSVRLWVPGCATGEEAFSLAMLVMEELDAAQKRCSVQVFATDMDDEAIQVGRMGLYPASIAADVSAARLAAFFEKDGAFFRVKKALRDAVVFAVQNVVSDPPFSRIDIISCRNLLIYLEPDAQGRVLSLLNYALSPGGCLFLGKSEGTGRSDLFEPVAKRARIFRRLAAVRPVTVGFPARAPGKPAAGPAELAPKLPAGALADLVRQQLLDHFAASVVLIDRRGQIVQFLGSTRRYLDLPLTEPNLNLLDIAREGLGSRLRAAVHTAFHDHTTAVLDNVAIPDNGNTRFVRVTVRPMPRTGDADLAAVFFEEIRPPAAGVPALDKAATQDESVVRQLEFELKVTRDDLQSTIEELQTSNEELRAANEEITSMNEELQSTNEELETSKEELQSINEELITVNSQLQEKVELLDQANSDVSNLLRAADIATIFLKADLTISMFTPPAARLLNLVQADVGRPFSHFAQTFDPGLVPAVRQVLAGEASVEKIVNAGQGPWYMMRILPYRNADEHIEGVVITLTDVTRLREAEERIRRLATVLIDSNDAVTLLDPRGSIVAWNRGAERMYGWNEAEALRMNVRDITPPDKIAESERLLQRLAAGEAIDSYETQRRTRDGRILDVWMTVTRQTDESGQVSQIATTERDVTRRNETERQLRSLNEGLERRVAERTAQIQRLALLLTEAEQRERRRLARAIHDNLQQLLVGCRFGIEMLRTQIGPAHREGIEEVLKRLGECITESRALTFDLSPPILEDAGLAAALHWLARQMKERFGLTVAVTQEDFADCTGSDACSFVFQAARELLFNVVKHSGTSAAQVALSLAGEDRLRLRVCDEGSGFDPAAVTGTDNPQGFGLFSVRERLRLMGGTMEIDSHPGGGARISLEMPLSPLAAAQLLATDLPGATVSLGGMPTPPLRGHVSPVNAGVAQPPSAVSPGATGGLSASVPNGVHAVNPDAVDHPSVPKPATAEPPFGEAGSLRPSVPSVIRILLVDDHPALRHGLARVLQEESDVEVVGEASGGEEGVRLATDLRPDIVLMDVTMPDLNGFEATARIRKAAPDVRVVGLSMHEEAEVGLKMREAGAVGYLSKSASSDDLLAMIRAVSRPRPA